MTNLESRFKDLVFSINDSSNRFSHAVFEANLNFKDKDNKKNIKKGNI